MFLLEILFKIRHHRHLRLRFLNLSVFFFGTRISLRNFAVLKFYVMKKMSFRNVFMVISAVVPLMTAASCEIIDDDFDKHVDSGATTIVELADVATLLSAVPLELTHLNEVHQAVESSSVNGYDEEYTMADLFEQPGRGVGESRLLTRSSPGAYENPLRDLIRQHVLSSAQTKSGGERFSDPEAFLNALTESDIQIYWPFSESWDGETMPVITFDPEDGSDANIGYRIIVNEDGSRGLEEVVVDEQMAALVPVWVVNRNSDAEYTSLELLRREDPEWGDGGGSIIVKPSAKATGTASKGLILKDFTMHRNYDTWFAGASEFFVKVGYVDDFTAATEAELKMYNPKVTDFMIVVKRSQSGKPQTFNTLLISDWNGQMSHCAFMITEDDGGTQTEWKCTALVRIKSMSYGVELNLPLNTRDDIVWRGQLAKRWIDANTGIDSRFGDVSMTFDLTE